MAIGEYGLGIGLWPLKTTAERVLDEAVALNDMPGVGNVTFVRATSAYDPKNNVIVAPGVRRRRPATIGRYRAFGLDLVEGARANLLAAGSSEFRSGWTVQGSTIPAGGTAPTGEAAIFITEDGTNAAHDISQAVTKAASALPYAFSVSVARQGRDLQINLDDGAFGGGVFAVYNLATGALTSNCATYGAGWTVGTATITKQPNGNYLCTITGTSNTTTTIRPYLYLYSGGTTYQGGGVLGVSVSLGCLEQAAFPSSPISNRNLHIQSNNLANAAWTATDTTVTANSTANPISGLVDSALLTEGSAGTAQLQNAASLTVTSGATMTVSRYFKRGNTDYVVLQASNGAITSGFNLWVNLNTGLAGSFAAFGTGSAISQSVVAVVGKPGWYRVTATGTIGAFAAGVVITRSAASDGSASRVANSTRFEANVQWEYGATATTYWGVNATVGGRDQDALTINLSSLPGGGTSTTAGTLMSIAIPYGWTGNAGAAVARVLDDDAVPNTSSILYSAAGALVGRKVDSLSALIAANGPAGTPTNATLSTACLTWTPTAVTTYLNGLAGTPNTTFTPPFGKTTSLEIGTGTGRTQPSFTWVAVLSWNRALVPAEILAEYVALPVLS